MPELAEVEYFRKRWNPGLGRKVVGVRLNPKARVGRGVDTRALAKALTGAKLLESLAAAKQMAFRFTGGAWLGVHLGMTGRLSVSSNAQDQNTSPDPKSRQDQNNQATSPQNSWAESAAVDSEDSSSLRHLRAVWTLDDGRCLYFDDVRRFGRIAVVAAAEYHSLATLAALGPEPFDDSFTAEYLRAQINSSKRCIKTQLLAQRVVAGLGNIYVDEALWRSQVHPAAKRLTVMQSKKLRDDIRDVLSAAINNGGTTLRNYRDAAGATGSNQRYLDCYGRAGQDCLRCGSTLQRIVIDARATVYCPRCQKR